MRKGDVTRGENASGAPASGEVSAVPEILPDVPIQIRALNRLSRRERARYRRARRLLASGEGIRALTRANVTVAGLGVYEAVLAQSWAVRFDDPEEMIRLAEAALEISKGFSGKAYGLKNLRDFQARAWGELANAYRTADRLRPAQEAFGQAYALQQRGTGDLYLKVRLFDLEASLLGTLREFSLALSRLTSLSSLYKEMGEFHLAGRALITRALYTFYSGDTKKAITINRQGIKLIDRLLDPPLFMQALHNDLLFLVELGLCPEAKKVLFKSRPNLIYKDRVSALRLRVIEGQISYGLGELLSAEIAFREAREGLADTGMIFLVALTSLELAMALRSQDKVEEAMAEVMLAREIFLSLEISREYLGSVIFLEESFRRGEATTQLVEATVAHLKRKWFQMVPRRRQ